MLCDICGKNQATVHLTEIVDEQMTELHLCEECARAKSVEMEQQFGLADLLAGLSEFGKTPEDKESGKLKCGNCGISYDNFRKSGRLGCSDCYRAFERYLAPLLKKIHGSNKHIGKSPVAGPEGVLRQAKPKSDLDELKARLQRAIQAEEFEEAAHIRDKIRDLEKGGGLRNGTK